MDIFDEQSLVLKYQSKDVKKLSEEIYKSQSTKHTYPEFNPHITLASNFKKEALEKLIQFKGEILFDYFTCANKY